MPEFPVELLVLIVRDLQDSILHPKRVAVIVIQFMTGNLDGPALKVLAVEKTNPAILACLALFHCTTAKDGYQDQAQDGLPISHYPWVKILIWKLFVGHFQLLLKLILLPVESRLLQIVPSFCIPSYSFPFFPILLDFPTNRLPPVAGRGGMDWLFSGGVAAKDVDDESVVNLVDFLYAVLDSLMKAVFL